MMAILQGGVGWKSKDNVKDVLELDHRGQWKMLVVIVGGSGSRW